METGDSAKPSRQGDGKFLAAVGVLTLIILATLVFLWQRERRARLEAEQQSADTRMFRNMLTPRGGVLPFAPGGADEGADEHAGPVNRADLPVETVEWRDRQRPLLRISASAGLRFGFLPGDLVDVGDDAPATEPDVETPASPPGQ